MVILEQLCQEQFKFHSLSSTNRSVKIGKVLAKLQQVKPGAFLGHSVDRKTPCPTCILGDTS